MAHRFPEEFCWREGETGGADAREAYQGIVNWASRAREINPSMFDEMTQWVLDDAEWTDDKLAGNEQILMSGVFARFREQNRQLREQLTRLLPSGCVNGAVFSALDRFDAALAGDVQDDELKIVARDVFSGFSAMRRRDVRERFGGEKTDPTGTNRVGRRGFLNELKDLDAGVQWTLFMPDVVERQQKGFRIESFEYKRLPAMRFIGRAIDDAQSDESRRTLFNALDAMEAYRSGFDFDVLFSHHNGRGVDEEMWHGYFGRFMKAGTPVPQGFAHFDFVESNDGKPGAPYLSQFAYAVFSGDKKAIHTREGFDDDAMYDVTRNIMLGRGMCIPYPLKYWTAEVFPDGIERDSYAYMFSGNMAAER